MVKLHDERDLIRLYEGSPPLRKVSRPEAQALWESLPEPQRAELKALMMLEDLKAHCHQSAFKYPGSASGDRLDNLYSRLCKIVWSGLEEGAA